MELEALPALSSIVRLCSGFVDFMVAVVMIGIALTTVKKAGPKLGYVLAGVAGLRFLGTCCGRGATAAGAEMSVDTGEIGVAVSEVFRVSLDIVFFAGVAYVLFALAQQAAPEA